MTKKIIKMPALGESVHEATINAWLVKAGDTVKKYDPLAEVISDKVTTEVPSEYSGVIDELLVDEDEEIPIGQAILSIIVEGDGPDDQAEASPTAANDQEPAAETKEASQPAQNLNYSPAVVRLAQEKGIDLKQVTGSGKNGRITRKDVLKAADQIKNSSQSTKTSEAKLSNDSEKSKSSSRYSPAVLKLAQTHNIDLSQLVGTGAKGRITRKDVLAALESGPSPDQTANQSENSSPAGQSAKAQVSQPSQSQDQVTQADGIRKAIAKQMTKSYQEIPHAWMMVEADVTNIVNLRNHLKESYQDNEGIHLSYFPFFVKAVTQALKQHPLLNASWQEDGIHYHKDINLSIAVATEDHLYVPVIKQADRLSINGIAHEIDRLAQAVKNGKATSQDMQGGTFTVNNTGVFGSVQSMGIINPPQAAILQVESIKKRLLVSDDGNFKMADMVNLCLSIDHRLLDGLEAGRFLQDVVHNLAQFSQETEIY
ncbi:2-oxo acid dehydrogenase subunit E2 [Aerococcus urinae]|uniref:Dihydrolipoamide acetyltransferase component of pyruvate dehydrogenase complex n=1 Tax=Aerococcus urinae TaxID=1376 RepID=A0A0X8FFV8_9LACT|nr:2-oxo acid dehydrogenase subunit E2 [Aerococcus urinae]AMB96601.1 dihydrolipoamide succinyltransferase [Aerococcus urinae]MCY3033001.1 2-oxo acid dehydrogenase subunit E2 [Aerococcus urinae]MCY3038145.1 2-oxo acid dehydrogenase subunit E2 [Aerococcus urinae]MCY3045047.1 2-oxo acid dehydrogenase subunit E2 [Aerococcus urinae]MCY3048502.1 2-oxo acid dehydrogenase subunit E2 [Aerococcus urinae]